ncbi:MAG: ABC transporter substrate-binding protein, partial [Umezawaea sp.]
MRRLAVVLLFLLAACSPVPGSAPDITAGPTGAPRPADAAEVTAPPSTPAATPSCDATASLRPTGPLPAPGDMPAGSTMEKIAARGRLIAGVDQNTYLMGFRNPGTGALEGFDVD